MMLKNLTSTCGQIISDNLLKLASIHNSPYFKLPKSSTSNMFAQTARKMMRVPGTAIARASTAARDGVFKEKESKKIWLGDAGAYPVMAGLVWCVIFATGFGTWYMSSSPDVKLFGQTKKRLFRGEIAAEYTRPT
jgi:hypothetical protein